MGKKTSDDKSKQKPPSSVSIIGVVRVIFGFLTAILTLTLLANVVDFHNEQIKQTLMGLSLYVFCALVGLWLIYGVLGLLPNKKIEPFDPLEIETKQAAFEEKTGSLEKKIQEQADLIQKIYGDEYKKTKEENEALKADLERIAQEENENIRKELEELREKNNGLIDQLKNLAAINQDSTDAVGDIHAA